MPQSPKPENRRWISHAQAMSRKTHVTETPPSILLALRDFSKAVTDVRGGSSLVSSCRDWATGQSYSQHDWVQWKMKLVFSVWFRLDCIGAKPTEALVCVNRAERPGNKTNKLLSGIIVRRRKKALGCDSFTSSAKACGSCKQSTCKNPRPNASVKSSSRPAGSHPTPRHNSTNTPKIGWSQQS